MATAVSEKEKSTALIKIRVTPSQKDSYEKTAGGKRKMSAWAKTILDRFTKVV